MSVLLNDLFFSYKNVFRFIIIQQWVFLFNTNQLPYIKNLFFIFNIYSLIDLDEPRSFNYSYLFRFFFGKKTFFSKISSRFHLGVTYNNFSVFCFFNKNQCFFPLGVFINDIISKTTEDFFFSNLTFSGSLFSCWFADMNIFIEKKTNIGFYNLKDPLGLNLVINTYLFFVLFCYYQCLNFFLNLIVMMKIFFILINFCLYVMF